MFSISLSSVSTKAKVFICVACDKDTVDNFVSGTLICAVSIDYIDLSINDDKQDDLEIVMFVIFVSVKSVHNIFLSWPAFIIYVFSRWLFNKL